MGPTKLLIGQIIAVAATVLLGLWFSTQWAAYRLGDQPELGTPDVKIYGIPIYRPWASAGCHAERSGGWPWRRGRRIQPIAPCEGGHMRSSWSIRILACGLVLMGGAAEAAKPAARAHHAKPAARHAPPQQAEDGEEGDGWSGPVPRTQRGSRWYGHGIGWNTSPDGYYMTPAAPVYHHGTVTPGYPEDGGN